MRVFVVWPLAFLLFVAVASPAMAASGMAAEAGAVPDSASPVVPDAMAPDAARRPPLGELSMDQLFAALADPADEARGKAAEQEIQRRWTRSGSATIDLLMSWANGAANAKDYGRALDFLDQVVMLKPDYAEGWNRRATVFYMRDDYGKAIADIEKALALEPRHFGALTGLGLILQDIDRKADALAAFEKALAIDPYLDTDIKDAVKALKPEVEGRQI